MVKRSQEDKFTKQAVTPAMSVILSSPSRKRRLTAEGSSKVAVQVSPPQKPTTYLVTTIRKLPSMKPPQAVDVKPHLSHHTSSHILSKDISTTKLQHGVKLKTLCNVASLRSLQAHSDAKQPRKHFVLKSVVKPTGPTTAALVESRKSYEARQTRQTGAKY
uniref:Uncharacterized protein n=1 Tax=Ciona savignyi TaxID=51511 RepID=H2Z8N0_CIOSA